jgi:hypothetical protein
MKIQILIGLIASVVSVGGAVYQGQLCDRWELETSERLEGFAQRLARVPTQIGPWTSTEVEVDEAQFKESKCNGVVSRAYQNSLTGELVSVYLVSGKAYHVTIHTPDWCYVAAGFEMDNDPANYAVQCKGVEPPPDFLWASFKKETEIETKDLRIFWSYTDDGQWTSPKLAKQLFARKPALYKVYLITQIEGRATELSKDPSVQFAKEFMPVVNDALFGDDDVSTADGSVDAVPAGESAAEAETSAEVDL